MKNLIFSIIILCASLMNTTAQSAKIDEQGNYIAITKNKPKSEAKTTGRMYTDAKGKIYQVYESKNGKLFIIRTSKSGKNYNQYLKL